MLPASGELAKHAVSEGTKAVTKMTSRDGTRFSWRAGLQFPLFHQHLNSAFAAFIPEHVMRLPPLAGGSLLIAIQPRVSRGSKRDFSERFGHAFCLEVAGDDCVGDVMHRVRDGLCLSPAHEYALVLVKNPSNYCCYDGTNETLLDTACTLDSYGIDSRCLDEVMPASDSIDKIFPSLRLYKVNELLLAVWYFWCFMFETFWNAVIYTR